MQTADQPIPTEDPRPLKIETVTHVSKRIVLMPSGAKTSAIRESRVTLARVRFTEQPV